MRKLWLGLALLLATALLQAGNTIRLNGRYFTVLITEPDGWMLDTRAANQIAHFVIYPRGKTWRTADAVIFGRFVPREANETAENFLLEEEDRFQLDCPGIEIRKRQQELESPYPLLVNSFHCHSNRNELVAVVTVPTSFVVFLLGSSREATLDANFDVFKEVVEGFRWLPRDEPPRIQLPQPPQR